MQNIHLSSTVAGSTTSLLCLTLLAIGSLPVNDAFIMGGAKIHLSWEPQVADLIREKVSTCKEECSINRRPYMVGVVGIPGSGKTTSAEILSALLEKGQSPTDCDSIGSSSTNVASAECVSNVVLPMDGYHYPLETLRTFDNADDFIYRRGAPDTFDATALRKTLERIRNGEEDEVRIPGFDHARGDPQPDQHSYERSKHNVVICEGLYLFHDQHGWEGVRDMFDFCLFVEADVDVCVERLKVRNKCIPGYTAEEIEKRCDEVDRANADVVHGTRHASDLLVQSGAVKAGVEALAAAQAKVAQAEFACCN